MNAFEKMLREKFGFKWDFELLMVADLENVLRPADDQKAEILIRALLDPKNKLIPSIILGQGEGGALAYCRDLGWGVTKDWILRAAKTIKQA